MTLDEIRDSKKDVLTPADIAPVLGVNPQSIRAADPVDLGFPVIKLGTRTLIPRVPFLTVMEGSG
jgi:hypothetical protein